MGSFHFARRYFGNRCFFLFLRLLRCFSSPGSPHMTMYSSYVDVKTPGFPIRKSMDIMPVCGSPWLIAAYHVLHRLLAPRHPPCALISLISLFGVFYGSAGRCREAPTIFSVHSHLLLFIHFCMSSIEIAVDSNVYHYLYFTMSCSSANYLCYAIVKLLLNGGLKWTRTTDLTLIRRAL